MEHNKPQKAPKGTGREITPLVIKDLEMRSAMGKEKYGEALRAFNGRCALTDLYQELIDAVQYTRQLLEEKQQRDAEKRAVDAVVEEAVEDLKDSGADPEGTRHIEDLIAEDTIVYWPTVEQQMRDGEDFKEDLGFQPLENLDPDYTPRAKEFREGGDLKATISFGDAYVEQMMRGFKDLPYKPVVALQLEGGESIAQEAHRLVLGDRGEAYGHPIFDMTRSADMVTSLLRNKLRPGTRLEAEDIGQMMVCVKQSRHRNKPKRDNLTDTAGYALTLDMIAEWRAANPGVDPRDVFPA